MKKLVLGLLLNACALCMATAGDLSASWVSVSTTYNVAAEGGDAYHVVNSSASGNDCMFVMSCNALADSNFFQGPGYSQVSGSGSAKLRVYYIPSEDEVAPYTRPTLVHLEFFTWKWAGSSVTMPRGLQGVGADYGYAYGGRGVAGGTSELWGPSISQDLYDTAGGPTVMEWDGTWHIFPSWQQDSGGNWFFEHDIPFDSLEVEALAEWWGSTSYVGSAAGAGNVFFAPITTPETPLLIHLPRPDTDA